MLTIATIPKPFTGHAGIIQRNAIYSWMRLSGKVRVILFGDDPSVAEFAREEGLDHVREVPTTELGTPLLDFVFDYLAAHAATPLAGYINADILLTDRLLAAADLLRSHKRFLAVGQRIDLDLDEPLEFSADWQTAIEALAEKEGRPGAHNAIDYFLFPAHGVPKLPPFAVGRPGWDNWMICSALERGIPVIDLSRGVRAIHQNHDYAHVPQRTASNWEGPEADRNRRLALATMTGRSSLDWSILDASRVFHQGRIVRASPWRRVGRRFRRSRVYPWVRGLDEFCVRLSALAGVWRRPLHTKPAAIIFGAGRAGLRAAWFYGGELDIVAFADNDTRKQGTRLLRRPILSPHRLGEFTGVTILIASMHAPAIRDQLTALQLPLPLRIVSGEITSGVHERRGLCLLVPMVIIAFIAAMLL